MLGVLLGLSAGLAPGPLLTLVISETLRHGVRAGIKIAIAPMITDAPIIILTLAILSKLAAFHVVLGVLSLAGGLFVLAMGVDGLRTKGVALDPSVAAPKSLAKGILTNLLSPHPYLFWLSVGSPILSKAMDLSFIAPVAFVMGFYACLVGSKVALSILVGRSRSFLTGKLYIQTMRALGLALIVLAALLLREGFELLGVHGEALRIERPAQETPIQ